ncbi:MAG: mscL [Candidatus Peribacteria bacterium]|nr:mscL [Candidatus Peribacteria bacterium]
MKAKSLLREFRDFASRGSVIDLAVGVMIGGAFGKIVSSFVDDILMPPLSLLTGQVDFSNQFVNLKGNYATLAEAKRAGAATLNYGIFINNLVNFLIVAFAIFLMVRQLNALKKIGQKGEHKESAVATKSCPFCISDIPRKATRCPACTSELTEAIA